MKNIDNLLKLFEQEINSMNFGNLVIGGIWALKLHGLIINREPCDLDIIIYKPIDKQDVFLQEKFENKRESIFDTNDGEEGYRSWKMIKDGNEIDFLIES